MSDLQEHWHERPQAGHAWRGTLRQVGLRTACARVDVLVMAHARSLAAGFSFTARFGPLVMRNAVPPRPLTDLLAPCMEDQTLKPLHVCAAWSAEPLGSLAAKHSQLLLEAADLCILPSLARPHARVRMGNGMSC